MNIDTGDLGLRLHELAVTFNATIDVEVIVRSNAHPELCRPSSEIIANRFDLRRFNSE